MFDTHVAKLPKNFRFLKTTLMILYLNRRFCPNCHGCCVHGERETYLQIKKLLSNFGT